MYNQICEIICEMLGVDEESLSPETSFTEDLCCDSLDLVELAVTLQTEYNLGDITEEDLMSIKTVGDIVRYVEAHS